MTETFSTVVPPNNSNTTEEEDETSERRKLLLDGQEATDSIRRRNNVQISPRPEGADHQLLDKLERELALGCTDERALLLKRVIRGILLKSRRTASNRLTNSINDAHQKTRIRNNNHAFSGHRMDHKSFVSSSSSLFSTINLQRVGSNIRSNKPKNNLQGLLKKTPNLSPTLSSSNLESPGDSLNKFGADRMRMNLHFSSKFKSPSKAFFSPESISSSSSRHLVKNNNSFAVMNGSNRIPTSQAFDFIVNGNDTTTFEQSSPLFSRTISNLTSQRLGFSNLEHNHYIWRDKSQQMTYDKQRSIIEDQSIVRLPASSSPVSHKETVGQTSTSFLSSSSKNRPILDEKFSELSKRLDQVHSENVKLSGRIADAISSAKSSPIQQHSKSLQYHEEEQQQQMLGGFKFNEGASIKTKEQQKHQHHQNSVIVEDSSTRHASVLIESSNGQHPVGLQNLPVDAGKISSHNSSSVFKTSSGSSSSSLMHQQRILNSNKVVVGEGSPTPPLSSCEYTNFLGTAPATSSSYNPTTTTSSSSGLLMNGDQYSSAPGDVLSVAAPSSSMDYQVHEQHIKMKQKASSTNQSPLSPGGRQKQEMFEARIRAKVQKKHPDVSPSSIEIDLESNDRFALVYAMNAEGERVMIYAVPKKKR